MDGLIYAIGGDDGCSFLKSVEVFDPISWDWSFLPPMNIERSDCAAVELGGKIYVIGGIDDESNELSSVEVFDPTSGKWSFLTSMQSKRAACAAAQMGGKIYVIGGYDGCKRCSSVEVFDP
eukprot:5030609-Ditylum_brightwellii.AAC.1